MANEFRIKNGLIVLGAVTGSEFTGSFVGDGSALTGITAEWNGTHNGDAEITGSLIVSGSSVELEVEGDITITDGNRLNVKSTGGTYTGYIEKANYDATVNLGLTTTFTGARRIYINDGTNQRWEFGGTTTGASDNIIAPGNGYSESSIYAGHLGNIGFFTRASTVPANVMQLFDRADNNNHGVKLIYKSGGTYSDGLMLDNTGNVGIGNTSPAGKLNVKGSGTTSATTALLVQNSATTELFRVRDDGNVYGTGAGAIDTNAAYGKDAFISNATGTFNAAFGSNSLQNNTASWNTAFGAYALNSNTSGYNNVAVGINSLRLNISGTQNTAVGREALYSNSASANTAIGYRAAYSSTSAVKLTAIGSNALEDNTIGNSNVAVGYFSLHKNTTGADNVSVGTHSSIENISGSKNAALGHDCLRYNTASNNTAVGYQASLSNTTGTNNTAVGLQALKANTTSSNNTAVGYQASMFNTTGTQNTAVGPQALYSNSTSSNNTALGYHALRANTAANNTALGHQAGYEIGNLTGTSNTFLGYNASYGTATTITNSTAVGANVTLTNSNTVILGNNANVGIGITDPTARLQVKGSGTTSSTDALLVENSAGTDLLKVRDDGQIFQTGNTFTSYSTGEMRFRLHSSGATDSKSALTALTNGGSLGSAYGELSLNNTYDSNAYVGGAILFDTRTSQSPIRLMVKNNSANPAEAMAITRTGNVGIGTSSPAEKLTVEGNISGSGDINIVGDVTASAFVGDGSALTNIIAPPAGSDTQLQFNNAGTLGASNNLSYSNGVLEIGYIGGAHTKAIQLFGTDRIIGTDGSRQIRLYTDRVNIGEYAGVVDAALAVKGSGATSATTALLIENSAGTDLLKIRDDGNVGIGTTSPGYKLDVEGNGKVAQFKSTNTGSIGSVETLHENDAGHGLVLGSIGSGYTHPNWAGARYMYASAGDLMIKTRGSGTNLRFYTAGDSNERMRIDGSGNVGIGTTSPGYKLHVEGDVRIGQSNKFYINNNNVGIYRDSNNLALGGYGGIQFHVQAATVGSQAERMRIDSAGRVGIGTTSPTEKLHVVGDAKIEGDLHLEGDIDFRVINSSGFGQPGIELPNFIDTFWRADRRFTLSVTGGQSAAGIAGLFNGQYSNLISFAANSTHTITINVANQSGVPANGFTYPQGYIYISFYYNTNNYDSISGRVKDMNGVYYNMSGLTDIIPNDSNYKVMRLTVPGNNYVVEYELTLVTNANIVRLSAINYVSTRHTSQMELPYLAKTNDTSRLFGNVEVLTNTGGDQNRISGTGDSYFAVDTGDVGIGIAAPTAKLNVKGSGTTSSTTALLVENSSGTDLLKINDDGFISGTSTVKFGQAIHIERSGPTVSFKTTNNAVASGLIFQTSGGATSARIYHTPGTGKIDFWPSNGGSKMNLTTAGLELTGSLDVAGQQGGGVYPNPPGTPPDTLIGNGPQFAFLGAPDIWLVIKVDGVDYQFPGYV